MMMMTLHMKGRITTPTTLILVKGALDARGSKLMPGKKDFGYSFPCDGPGRGGTCDNSAFHVRCAKTSKSEQSRCVTSMQTPLLGHHPLMHLWLAS
jgi:hypothetical protein